MCASPRQPRQQLLSWRIERERRGTVTSFVYLPGTSAFSVRLPYRSRDFCQLRTTFIPVPGLSGYSVQHYCSTRTRNKPKLNTPVPQYPGEGIIIRIPTRNLCNLCKTSIPLPGLLWVMYSFHTHTGTVCVFRTTFITLPETCVSSVRT